MEATDGIGYSLAHCATALRTTSGKRFERTKEWLYACSTRGGNKETACSKRITAVTDKTSRFL